MNTIQPLHHQNAGQLGSRPCTNVAPKEIRPIRSALCSLVQNLQELDKELSDQHDQISPIVRPALPTPASNIPDSPQEPGLVGELDSINKIVVRLRDRVRNVTENLML